MRNTPKTIKPLLTELNTLKEMVSMGLGTDSINEEVKSLERTISELWHSIIID